MHHPVHVLHVLGVKNGRPNAAIIAQMKSLESSCRIIPLLYSAGGPSGYVRAVWQIREVLKETRIDAIHAHHARGSILASWANARRIPLIVSFLGTDLYNRGFVNRWAFRTAMRQATAIIVKSARMRLFIPRRENVHVIPNGVDFSLFKPLDRTACRRRLGLDGDRVYFLFGSHPGRSEKNYHLAEAAVERLRTSGRMPDCLLLPVYDVPQTKMPEYINACDCVLLTSHYEGSPNIIKEAMACNVRIVSTDVGDVSDIVGDTQGCAIADADPHAVSEALYKSMQTVGPTNGRDKISHLRIETIAERISHIYQDSIQKGGPRAGDSHAER